MFVYLNLDLRNRHPQAVVALDAGSSYLDAHPRGDMTLTLWPCPHGGGGRRRPLHPAGTGSLSSRTRCRAVVAAKWSPGVAVGFEGGSAVGNQYHGRAHHS